MDLPRPLYVSTRLMAAADVGDGAGTLHIAPVRRDDEDRVVWRYIVEDVEDGEHRELVSGEDLRSGPGDEVDPIKAMQSLVAFLGAAAEAGKTSMAGRAMENADRYPRPATDWAALHDEDLAGVAVELEGLDTAVAHTARAAQAIRGAVWDQVWSQTGCTDCSQSAVEGQPWGSEHCWATHRLHGPHLPSGPYLRAAGDSPVPAGWTTEPVGQWNGRDSEAVYNPRRHDVRVVPSGVTEDREGELAAAGWAYEGTDGYAVMWVRDRVAATRAVLNRTPPDAPELGGLGR